MSMLKIGKRNIGQKCSRGIEAGAYHTTGFLGKTYRF